MAANLLTADNVCERLKVHTATLRRWCKAGNGPPAVRIAGTLRFRESDVDAWILSLIPAAATELDLVAGALQDEIDYEFPPGPSRDAQIAARSKSLEGTRPLDEPIKFVGDQ